MNSTQANIYGFLAIGSWTIAALLVYYTPQTPPMLLSSVTSLIGFVLCVFYWVAKGDNPFQKFKMSFNAYAIGMFGICFYKVFWLAGLKLAPAFEANALNYLWPLLLTLVSCRVDKIKPSPLQIFGLVLGLVGSFFIFGRYMGDEDKPLYIFGLICSLCGAFVWAIYSSLTKLVTFECDRVGIFLLITAIISYCLHVIFNEAPQTDFDPIGIIAVILLGVSGISYVFWDKAMKSGDRQMLASLSYLIPVISVGLLAIFTPVSWTWQITMGSILIVMGCLVANVKKFKEFFSKTSEKP